MWLVLFELVDEVFGKILITIYHGKVLFFCQSCNERGILDVVFFETNVKVSVELFPYFDDEVFLVALYFIFYIDPVCRTHKYELKTLNELSRRFYKVDLFPTDVAPQRLTGRIEPIFFKLG